MADVPAHRERFPGPRPGDKRILDKDGVHIDGPAGEAASSGADQESTAALEVGAEQLNSVGDQDAEPETAGEADATDGDRETADQTATTGGGKRRRSSKGEAR